MIGKRIRLQGLPNFSKPGKDAAGHDGLLADLSRVAEPLRTMQHRLWDCYRQMRMPDPDYASDGRHRAHRLSLNKQAEGGEINVPSIKR